MRRRTRPSAKLLAIFGACALFAGCEENGGVQTPDPVGGGETFFLDAQQFADAVAPILAAKGCDAGGDCHGGGIRGTFELSPQSNKDVDFDFDQAVLQVNGYDPDGSPILTEPLTTEAGGTTHPLTTFESVDDPDYQTVLAWIEAGEFR